VLMSVLEPGDNCVVIKPSYQQHYDIPKGSGIETRVVQLKAEDNYQLDFDALDKACDDNTKMIVLTNPNNPIGVTLYDEGLTNPGFGGEVLRVEGCCCILFTGESDAPDTVRQLLLDEIERVRREGVDREIFTLCKNEKYGQLIENLENVEDSASQMADFALAGQTVAQQITMLAGLTAEDADAALQHILRPERMAMMRIEPDGTVGDEEEEETEE